MNMSQPVTVAEAAVMLNVSPAYVVRLIGNGKLRASEIRMVSARFDVKKRRLTA
jgi:excisionase family DNA binding protein